MNNFTSEWVIEVKTLPHGLLIIIFLLLASIVGAQEKTSQCNSSNVVVLYDRAEDYQLACQSASEVNEIAKRIGLPEQLYVNLAIVDTLFVNKSGKALALFNPGTMSIQVLSLDACKKTLGNKRVLGQKIDKEIHKSLIIHELAHALFWQNKGSKIIPRKVHEYFAYNIQFALLEASHREKIIFSVNLPAFTNWSEITETYYLLSPTCFAVKSYLHFINSGKGWPGLLDCFDRWLENTL